VVVWEAKIYLSFKKCKIIKAKNKKKTKKQKN